MFITHGCPFGLCCSTPLHTNGIIISKVGFQFRNEQALKIYNMLALHINLISIKLVPRFYLFILIMLLSTRRFLFILRIILVLLSSFESYFFLFKNQQKHQFTPLHHSIIWIMYKNISQWNVFYNNTMSPCTTCTHRPLNFNSKIFLKMNDFMGAREKTTTTHTHTYALLNVRVRVTLA